MLFSSFFPFVVVFLLSFFLYDNNGKSQRLGTNLELGAEFQSFFPLKWSRDKPSIFTRWKDELNHGGGGGVYGKFLHILVQEFVS